ncbi:hypothetical protein [Sinorhizobium medicae]|uniref:hypothetical protein n=1 Tax=Sinorhizobium medicae TaxID=110321 RepID=UPI003092B4DD|nr:hypothetical protein U8C38_26540 [Sinorhizobium medicae]
MPELVKLDFDPIAIAHASPLSIAVCPADPKTVALTIPALSAFEQRPKLGERDVVAILASDGPSVNPLVVVALGAARAEQLIVCEIGEPQMTDAAIRINDSFSGIRSIPRRWRIAPPPYRRGFPMKMVFPSRFSHFLHRILGASRRMLCFLPKRAARARRLSRSM